MQKWKVAGIEFEVPEYFCDLRLIGIGSSGAVCSALDLKGQKMVAIKKISNFLANGKISQRCYREVTLLEVLKVKSLLRV